MKVLLLNPPGKEIYIREYYCSKVSKSGYTQHPIDLLMLSGTLATKHEVSVIDAIAEKLTPVKCEALIEQGSFDVIVFITGSVSWIEDSEFLESIKNKTSALMIGTGDILLEDYKKLLLENNFLDAILFDFTSDGILAYLDKNFENVTDMAFKVDGEVVSKETSRAFQKEFYLPTPRYELFPNKKYNYPFVLHHPFASILTDYGCPFKCNFCVMVSLGFKFRGVKDIIEEINYVKKLGFKDLYFVDQTFGVKRERLIDICNAMIAEKINMGWVCWSRVDVVNKDILLLMKKAGCHTILFGVETSNDKLLKENRKGFTSSKVRETFLLCRELGIRTLGTFIFGLPGDDRESCLRTIEFAREIKADFASFNVLIPRKNTEVRKEAIKKGLINTDLEIMDQSGSFVVMELANMTGEEILKIKDLAIKKFYLRPSYILRRLITLKSLYELRLLILNGVGLIKKTFYRKKIR